MKEHHLQLNLAKTELLVFPATPTLQLGSSTITPSASVRNLGVIFDDQLTFKEHIAKTARSCRFALHNIRKIRPFLTEHAAQLLVQALVISRLDYCNALLAGLPSCTIKRQRRLVVSSQRGTLQNVFMHRSWLVECTPPPPPISKQQLKTHLFHHHLTSSLKKKKKLSFLNFALFPLTSHCLPRNLYNKHFLFLFASL